MDVLDGNHTDGSWKSPEHHSKVEVQWFHQFYDFEYCFWTGQKFLKNSSKTLNITLAELSIYYKTPWIITKLFFKAVDSKNQGYLTYFDYKTSHDCLNTYNIDTKIKFIFDTWDVNKDGHIYIEDVKMWINYSYIYFKFRDMQELNILINGFFKNRTRWSFEKYKSRIYESNSDVFILFLFLFYHARRYNAEILDIFRLKIIKKWMESSEDAKGGWMDYDNIILILFNIKTDISMKIQRPSKKLNTLIFENFDVDILALNTTKKDANNSSSNRAASPYDNSACNSRTSIFVEEEPVDEFDDYDEDLTQLMCFEKDIFNVFKDYNNNYTSLKFEPKKSKTQFEPASWWKHKMEDDLTLALNVDKDKYTIPWKGSNDVIMKSGVIEASLMSNHNWLGDHNGSSNKIGEYNNNASNIWSISTDHKQKIPRKSSFSSQNSFLACDTNVCDVPSNKIKTPQAKLKSDNWLQYANVTNPIKNKNKSSVSFSMFSTKEKDTSFSKIRNSPPTETPKNSNILKEKTKFYIQTKENCLKVYYYKLITGFLLIFSYKKNKLQAIIPWRNWFIKSSKDLLKISSKKIDVQSNEISANSCINTQVNESSETNSKNDTTNYYTLNLCNTTHYKALEYQLIFDHTDTLQKLSNSICLATNYKTLSQNYTKIKNIGKGSYGSMYWMKEKKTGFSYAIKMIDKKAESKEDYDSLFWEEDISKFIINYNFIFTENADPMSNHVIKIYDIFQTWEHIYFVMEYVSNGSLGHIIRSPDGKLSLDEIKKISHQIIKGISFLNNFGIIHRDWKLENWLISKENEIKIIDFGLSQVITPLSRTDETFGTLLYTAPEILLNKSYDFRVDLWSFGVIIYYLIFGVMPFYIKGNENQQIIANKIVNCKLEMSTPWGWKGGWDEKGDFLVKWIMMCLVKNIDKRITVKNVLNLFEE